MTSKIIPVIMCGGAGTRLWPASRESMPKQFIALLGQYSTFQETILRISDPEIFDKPIVITSADFRFLVADQISQIGADADIVLEPFRRDSGPAVAVATVLGLQRSPDAVALILASDHAIAKPSEFRAACVEALPVAAQGSIVTFGVVPTEPATGYGYLKTGSPIGTSRVCKLEAFAEKPNAKKAAAYVEQGYLWNSGNFLFSCSVMKKEIEILQPEIWSAAESAVQKATRDLDFTRLEKTEFGRAPKISIDYAVMEKTSHSAVLPVDFGWSDLGSWDAIWSNSPQDSTGNALFGTCEVLGVKNSLIQSSDQVLTTVIGLNDILVVACADAVLVAPRTVTDEVKVLVEKMKASGRTQASEHRRIYRPWGFFETLIRDGRYQVKRILVNPSQSLSLQKHYHRSEHWVVVRGTGEIIVADEVRMLHENESTYIAAGTLHRISNPGRLPLELVEVAVGSYLEEDDIVRFEDSYNRLDMQ